VLGPSFGPAWHVRLHSPLALGEESELEPDVAVVSGTPLDYVSAHPATAALVVEIADSSLRVDRRVKASAYARAGLPEYWIVNLVESAVEVHRDPQAIPEAAHGSGYRAISILRPPAAIAPLSAPDRPVLVADLLP